MLDHQPPAVVFERLPDGDAVVRLYDNIKDAADVAQPGETDPEQEPGSAYLPTKLCLCFPPPAPQRKPRKALQRIFPAGGSTAKHGKARRSPDCRGTPGRHGRFYGRNHGGLTHMSKYYTTARLLYRLHKITADQVWAYTESDPPKITEDEALAICGPRAKDETAGS